MISCMDGYYGTMSEKKSLKGRAKAGRGSTKDKIPVQGSTKGKIPFLL